MVAKKEDLVKKIAEKKGIPATKAKEMVDTVLEAVRDAILDDGGVRLTNLFTIDIKTRAERQAKNPRTGETITIPASKHLHIKTGNSIKEILNS